MLVRQNITTETSFREMSLGMARVAGGLRGLLLASRAQVIPTMAPRHIIISLQFQRSFLTSSLVRSKVGEEEEVVVTVGNSSRETRMTYRELKEKAAGRNLVRVKVTKKVETVARFKIMSDVDLEVSFHISPQSASPYYPHLTSRLLPESRGQRPA